MVQSIKYLLMVWAISLSMVVMSAATAATTDNGIRVPFKEAVGMKLFKNNCMQCHGEWAKGTEQGPPLIHDFYKPSHHGDGSFYSAALNGVKAHHWHFGDMPPVAGVQERDVGKIISFVRWLQQANGLY